MSKQKIKFELCTIPEDYFEGSLETVVALLAEYEKIYANFSNLTVNADYYTNGKTYNLSGERLEDDKEYERRLEQMAKQKKMDEKQAKKLADKERKEYLRLKKLFGE